MYRGASDGGCGVDGAVNCGVDDGANVDEGDCTGEDTDEDSGV